MTGVPLVNLAVRWSENPDRAHVRAATRMAASLNLRPDALAPETSESCWLGAEAVSASTEPSRAETQWAVLVADSRLQNRLHLARALSVGLPASDADLLLAAWDKWGTDCPRHLEGDFAFAVWDRRRRQLMAARDVLGVRALMVGRQPGLVTIASKIETALAGLNRRPGDNLDFMRDVIVGSPRRHAHASPYQHVEWLPPAHRVVVSDGRCDISRFATLESGGSAPSSRRSAVSQLRDALAAAVEVRLEGNGPAAVMVSGGFDSSSVLLLAQEAAARGRYNGVIRSYSATFERLARADERAYLDDVLTKCPSVVATKIQWDDGLWSLDRLGASDGLSLLDPPLSARSFSMELAKLARQDGCHSILKGNWADQLLLRHPTRFGRLLADLPLRTLTHVLPEFWRSRKIGALVGLTWLVLDRLSIMPGSARPTSRNRRYQRYLRGSFVTGRHAAAMNYYDRLARLSRLEHRYPYLDLDLHRLMLRTPTLYLVDGQRPKPLLADAMADLLPDSFRARSVFGFVGAVTTEGLRKESACVQAVLANPRVVERGVVGPRELRRALASLERSPTVAEALAIQRLLAVELALTAAESLDLWYDSRETNSKAV